MTTTTSADRAGLRLFCSYAHEDRSLLEELRTHLAGMERSGLISGWDDRMITAGADWEGTMLDALERADVILLLISADFLASDYCWDVEMRRALVRQAAAEALVVPVFLRPCDWVGAPFASLQGLPSEGRPVVSWSPRDAGFLDVAEGLRRALQAREARAEATARVAPTSRGAETSESRVMDGAVARVVPVGRATDVVAMVRLPDSGGLRAILETDTSYTAEPGDVRAADFEMDFPVDADGRPEEVEVVLRLESADFEPPMQEKTIEVRPGRDSRTCVFLVTPAHAGPLVLNLELRQGGVSVVQQLLRTNGSRGVERRAMPAYVVHSTSGGEVPPLEGADTLVAPAPSPPEAGADEAKRMAGAEPPRMGRGGAGRADDTTLAGASEAPAARPEPAPRVSEGDAESRGCLPLLIGLLVVPPIAAVVLLLLR